MANFYWIGGGCVDRKSDASGNRKWGISQFDFNNPNNWVVHYGKFTFDLTASKNGSVKNVPITTDVYVGPNRAPGPVDNVIVGHYPWLKNKKTATFGQTPGTIHLTNIDDRFYNRNYWGFDYLSSVASTTDSIPVFFSGTGPYADSTFCYFRQQVSIPRETVAKEVDQALYTNITQEPTQIGKEVKTAVIQLLNQNGSTVFDVSTGVTASSSNNTSGPNYSQFASEAVRNGHFSFAQSPLLYGGQVHTNWATTPIGLTTDRSTIFQAGGTNAAAVAGVTGIGLHRFIVVNYGNTMRGSVLPGMASISGVSGSNYEPTLYDVYPYTSVGDGLWGKNYNTVIQALKSGLNNQLGCTGVSGAFYNNILTQVQNKSLTGGGYYNWDGLRIKAREVVTLTPMAYNKWPHPNYEGRFVTREGHSGEVAFAYNDTTPLGANSVPAGTEWLNQRLNKFDVNEYTNTPSYIRMKYGPNVGSLPVGFANGGLLGAHTQNTFLDKEIKLRMLPMGMTFGLEGRPATTVNSHVLHGTVTIEEGWLRGQYGTQFASSGEEHAQNLFKLENLETRIYSKNSSYPPITANKSFFDTELNPDHTGTFSPIINPFWPSKAQHYIGIGGNTTGNSPVISEKSRIVNTSATIFPEVYMTGLIEVNIGPGDLVEISSQCVKPSDIGISGGPWGDQSNDGYGQIFVGHGFPVANTNKYGGSQGNLFFGSSYTADNIVLSVISAAKFDTDLAKSASITLWGNTNIGDIELENTNLSIYSSQPVVYGDGIATPDYDMVSGDRLVDRIKLQKDSDIDTTLDTYGTFRVGRMLGTGITLASGATSATAGIFGGIFFDDDREQVIRPAANSRWWVSSIPNGQYDLRQTQLSPSYLAPTTALQSYPNALMSDGNVASTARKDWLEMTNRVPQFSEYVHTKSHTEGIMFPYPGDGEATPA